MKLTSRKEILIPLAAAVIAIAGLIGASLAFGIFGFGTGEEGVGRLATASLLYALPDAYSESGDFKGLLAFDASTMNDIRTGAGRRLRFVSASVSSNGPDVISVNVIDNFTWGAAAFSREEDACYLILLIVDSTDPSNGTTKYGVLESNQPCVGEAASLATTVDQEWS